jgi:hypothetical protein
VTAWICGDARASNFGLYASPERLLVMDINDFDETLVGPWEWDLERPVASIILASGEAGSTEDYAATRPPRPPRTYRPALRELAALPVLNAFYLTTDEKTVTRFDVGDFVSLGSVGRRS